MHTCAVLSFRDALSHSNMSREAGRGSSLRTSLSTAPADGHPYLDAQAEVDEHGRGDEGRHRANNERAVIDRRSHATRLLDEAPARTSALRALPALAQLLERTLRAGLVDVAAVRAHPLAGPVALILELLSD